MFNNQHGIRWAIAMPGVTQDIIGSAGIFLLSRHWFSGEIGFELHPKYWRHGIMSETLKAVIDFIYNELAYLQINRIQALTYLGNEASIALLKKLGFRQEGILREYGYWKEQFHDLRCFSLLPRDWPSKRTG